MSLKKLHIHVKILTRPKAPRTIGKMITAMRQVYASANIDVKLASRKVLNTDDPELAALNDLDVGSCSKNQPTDDQKDLAQFRNDVPDREIVIYVCHSLSDGFGGCAVHPDDNKPMAAISAKNASLYTLAHEVGHLLGLEHTTTQDENQLMTGNGTSNLVPIPLLAQSEIDKVRDSPFLT